MGSKKKNKKSQKKYPKKRTHRQAFGKLSRSKSKGKKKFNKKVNDLGWLLKDLKIMEDEKSDLIKEKKTNDNINKNLENLNEQKEILTIEINSKKHDNINNIYEICLIRNEVIYLSEDVV